MSVTVKDICEFIWWLENKYALLTLESDDVKFWQIARMKVYYSIAEKVGVLEQPHKEIDDYGRFLSILNYVKNSIASILFFRKRIDALLVEHPRGVNIGEDKIVDIYTYYVARDLRLDGTKCVSLEPSYLGKHIKSPNEYSVAMDGFSIVARIFEKFYKVQNKKLISQTSTILKQELFTKFGIQLNLYNLLVSETKTYKAKYRVAKWIFAKLKLRTLYVVVSYGYFHFVKAANDLGVDVVELQHGTFSKYHLGYSYPEGLKDTSYFPDYLHVWSDYWKKTNVLPIKSENVITTGFVYGKEKFEKYRMLPKKKQLTILSQGVIGKRLSSRLGSIIEKFPEYDIYFKLHPGEYGRWENYPLLKEMEILKKVFVVEDTDLYKLLAESEFQIGVFSTALFEGLDLGCKTILIDLPGIEYMDELIQSGEVYAIY